MSVASSPVGVKVTCRPPSRTETSSRRDARSYRPARRPRPGTPASCTAGCGHGGMRTPARDPNTSVNTARYRDPDCPELVSRQAATLACGSIRRYADWPTVSPSCPMIARPSHRSTRQPSPMAAPGDAKSGITVRGCCMAVTEASLSSRLPSGVSPPSRWNRAKASRSCGAAVIRPAGPTLRGSPQTRTRAPPRRCPTAARCKIASSGRVTVWASSSGMHSRSASESSHDRPSSTSIIRPSRTQPLLQ